MNIPHSKKRPQDAPFGDCIDCILICLFGHLFVFFSILNILLIGTLVMKFLLFHDKLVGGFFGPLKRLFSTLRLKMSTFLGFFSICLKYLFSWTLFFTYSVV